MELTAEQRARKNELARARRAAAKVTAAVAPEPTPEVVEAPTPEPIVLPGSAPSPIIIVNADALKAEGEVDLPADLAEALTAIYEADLGDTVTGLFGSPLKLVRVNQRAGWLRVLTTDGGTVRRRMICDHEAALSNPELWGEFEQVPGPQWLASVGTSHGFYHAASYCRKLTRAAGE